MKYVFTLLIGILGLTAFAQQTITAESAHIVIDGTTSREQLAEIGRQLYEQGIKFSYNPNLAPDRTLHGITFTILSGDGLISGEGSHTKLNYANSKVIIDINKTTNAIDIQYEGQR